MSEAAVELHPHAAARIAERSASAAEVVEAVRHGARFPAKLGRSVFRYDLVGEHRWRGKRFDTKRIEAYAVFEDDRWLVITVIVKFF